MTAEPALGKQPSRMKPTDLGKTFSSSPRSVNLRGLAPMERAPAPSTPAQAESGVQGGDRDDAALATDAAPKPISSTAKQPRSDVRARPSKSSTVTEPSASSGMQTIVVYVSASIRERLRANAGEFTFTELALIALDDSHSKLTERFASWMRPANSMFAGRGRPTQRRHSEPHVQVSLRPLRDDLAVIDRLVLETRAPSRSALINAALDEYLPEHSRVENFD